MLKLIDEVLAISRIEAGHMHLSLEPVAIGEVVRECLSLVGQQATERGVRLVDHCGTATAYVQADRQRCGRCCSTCFPMRSSIIARAAR